MSDERRQILQMLADEKISVDEAERLLAALGEDATPEPSIPAVSGEPTKRPKFLHVKVQSEPGSHHRHDNVDIKIPIVLLKAGIKLGSLVPQETRSKFHSHLADKGLDLDLNNLDAEKIDVLVQALTESSIDIDSDKEKVQIYCA